MNCGLMDGEKLFWSPADLREDKSKRALGILILWGFWLIAVKPSDVRAQTSVPRFELGNCLVEVPSSATIDCGTLITLENQADAQSRVIRLPVIIIRSENGNRSQEALLFTEGGPGFSSMGSVWWLASSRFGRNRDIVILEQQRQQVCRTQLVV